MKDEREDPALDSRITIVTTPPTRGPGPKTEAGWDLAEALTCGADMDGDLGPVAAIDLLIRHGSWLDRPEAIGPFTAYSDDGSAVLNWHALHAWAVTGAAAEISRSAATVLKVATTLALDTLGLHHLDHTNAHLVVQAVDRFAHRDYQRPG